jgi:large subunit ribosomal protein L7e
VWAGCRWDWQINSAVFMKVNSASINMLRLAGPYVTYGSPNLKTVRELVYKRGFASISKQRIPITDNKIISDALGTPSQKSRVQCDMRQ